MKLSYATPDQLDIDLTEETSRWGDGLVAVVLSAVTVERAIALEVWSRFGQSLRFVDVQIILVLGLAGLFTYRFVGRKLLVQGRLDRRSRLLLLRRSRLLGRGDITAIPWAKLSDLRLVIDPKDPDYWLAQLTFMERTQLTTLQLGDRTRNHQLRLRQVNEMRRFLGWSTYAAPP